ncbi:MAG: SpoIIE family protein phosphatase [Actinomycetota bacterium]|nr:SpoIIE family protein phosphatase [Actinomycetota bacterium]
MSSTRPAATARSGRGLPEARAPQEAVGDDGTGAALRRRRLTPVLRDSPACVLLLDLADQGVVQANTAGGDLVPGLRLPTSVPEWVAAAGLRRTDGSAHAPGDDPVSRIAAGEAVDGEPVLVAPHASPLWMTGFAIPHHDDAPSQALVVLFALDGGADAEVRDRAVLAAGLSFTISDPRLPDNPLVFVNPAFERTTGYRREKVQGRNCRFLQGPDTDPDAVEAVRKALRGREHRTVTLLNYRKDSSAFCNELAVSPVVDATGELTHFVGIQSNVTARVAVEHERERHLAAERAARSAAERAQRRLALLAEATSMLAATLDVDESLERLTSLVVPLMADWCTVHLRTPDGRVQRTSSRHRDESQAHLLRRLEELQPTGLTDDSNIAHVLAGAPATLVHIDEEVLTAGIADEELALIYRELSPRSALVVPLAARRQVLGVLSLFTDGSGRTYDDDDLVTAADLARRAALTVDNARLYQREHDVAEQLQRSLLPQLPTVAGLDRWARYLPGSTATQVGGDWYDLFRLPDGPLEIAIGDVMGHDMAAAASMGQLRSVLQSYAWQGSDPAVVLDRLDQLVQGLDMAQLATCAYGRLELPAGGRPGRLRLANAGHLPPALRAPDGTVELIASEPSLLVGAALGTDRQTVEVTVERGSVLVLYTDGLVEHRGRGLDEGLSALQDALANAPADAKGISDHLLAELAGDLEDDVALLVLRVL